VYSDRVFVSGVLAEGQDQEDQGEFVRFLPDTVDLLGLCVNAGLDFMMALKWVVEKVSADVVTYEMNILLQEISVGKALRDALRDLADKIPAAGPGVLFPHAHSGR
jgi:Flp pilus assembly protein TadB